MSSRSRRDREARRELEEEVFAQNLDIKNIEIGLDGKPCRACSAATTAFDSLKNNLSPKAMSGKMQRTDCAPDVNQIGNSGWVSHNVFCLIGTKDEKSPNRKQQNFRF